MKYLIVLFVLLPATAVFADESTEPGQNWQTSSVQFQSQVFNKATGQLRALVVDQKIKPNEYVVTVATIFAKPNTVVLVQRACDRYHPKLGLQTIPENNSYNIPLSNVLSLSRIMDPLPGRACSLLVRLGKRPGETFSLIVSKETTDSSNANSK